MKHKIRGLIKCRMIVTQTYKLSIDTFCIDESNLNENKKFDGQFLDYINTFVLIEF